MGQALGSATGSLPSAPTCADVARAPRTAGDIRRGLLERLLRPDDGRRRGGRAGGQGRAGSQGIPAAPLRRQHSPPVTYTDVWLPSVTFQAEAGSAATSVTFGQFNDNGLGTFTRN